MPAILVDAGNPQSAYAVPMDGGLPPREFLDGEPVTVASLIERKQPALYGCDDLSLPANYPALSVWRRQVGDRDAAAIGADDELCLVGLLIISKPENLKTAGG